MAACGASPAALLQKGVKSRGAFPEKRSSCAQRVQWGSGDPGGCSQQECSESQRSAARSHSLLLHGPLSASEQLSLSLNTFSPAAGYKGALCLQDHSYKCAYVF